MTGNNPGSEKPSTTRAAFKQRSSLGSPPDAGLKHHKSRLYLPKACAVMHWPGLLFQRGMRWRRTRTAGLS